ncbi:MAG: GNAT family N-acetyltransferase [Gemmobacter sp.]|jgi:RimJ/RimL family protein N-acetyltransferase|nr:GNAT family N-acetyltransferase [Gemmobacter sp.]
MLSYGPTPVLETERLILRAPVTEDFEPFAACMASDRAVPLGGPLSRVLAWRSFGHLTGHWIHRGYGMFVLVERASGAAIGMSGPWFPEGWPEPEIGWTIWVAEAEGKGYAAEAALAARAYAYDALGWPTAISLIVPGNTRSEALARRMGCVWERSFVYEQYGECGIWRHPVPGALAVDGGMEAYA